MHIRTENSSARIRGRGPWRTAGVLLAGALAVGLSAGPAGAAPRDVAEAQAAADALAARIAEIDGTLGAARAAVEAARSASAIALDDYQSTQAAWEAARQHADATAAEAAVAAAALDVARGRVVSFARNSYMQGSTFPEAAALLTAAGPGQLIERAALLEAAGSHRSDVLAEVTVVEDRAARADVVARTAVAEADQLQAEAALRLSVAQEAERSAREQAAALAEQQVGLEAQLGTAQQQLRDLVGAREAAERVARLAPARTEVPVAAPPSVGSPVAVPPSAAPPSAPPPSAPRPSAPPAAAPSSAPPATPPPASPSPRPPATGGDAAPGPANPSTVQRAIDAAMTQLGLPYAWGGGGRSGPGPGLAPDEGVVGFDCSGLTQYAYGQAGIAIPRNSRAQYAALPQVPAGSLAAGDLVFWATDPANPSTIYHVAIYLGDGRVVQAPQSGDVVKVSAMWWRGYAGAVRPSA